MLYQFAPVGSLSYLTPSSSNNKPSPSSQGPSSPPESQDETMTGLSDFDHPSPTSNQSDMISNGRIMRFLRVVLEDFDIRLGLSQPPDELFDAASDFLERVGQYLEQQRRDGNLGPLNIHSLHDDDTCDAGGIAATTESSCFGVERASKPGAGTSSGKPNESSIQGDAVGDSSTTRVSVGQREKRKRDETAAFPCLHRKRNPSRYNIRDYEYCAKAPFPDMATLK